MKTQNTEYPQGKVGMMLAFGEVVLTSSGNKTTPFPEVQIDTHRKALATVKRVDAWLRENAILEARRRGDTFNLPSFEREDPKNMPQATKDGMEEYLFGFPS